jgi:hypothetical protein
LAALPPDGAGSGAGFDELTGVGEEVVVVRAGVVVWVGVVELDCTEASSVDAVVVAACCTGAVRAVRAAGFGRRTVRRAGCATWRVRSRAVGGFRLGPSSTCGGAAASTAPPGESLM